MDIICEICANEEHNYLPYKMNKNLYIHLHCHVCNETINICYDCKKYLWVKPTFGSNNVPNEYRRVVNELCKNSYSKCKKCWDKYITGDFAHCYKCRIFTSKKNMSYCSYCNTQNCNDCNKDKCINCNTTDQFLFV